MKQIALISLLSVVGCVAAFGGLIASRLSAEAVALLAGVVCGVGVAVPVGVMAGTVLADRRRRSHPAASLPVIYVTQPPEPTMVGSQPIGARVPQPQAVSPVARTLNIIGQTAFDADK